MIVVINRKPAVYTTSVSDEYLEKMANRYRVKLANQRTQLPFYEWLKKESRKNGVILA